MSIIIRYAHPEVRDQYICKNSAKPAGFWQSGRQGGYNNAFRFDDKATAKGFLAEYKYDLPPLKVTFESVA